MGIFDKRWENTVLARVSLKKTMKIKGVFKRWWWQTEGNKWTVITSWGQISSEESCF